MGQVVVAESYSESHKKRYREFLSQVGHDVVFESDKWVCDAYLRNPSDYRSKVTISFKKTPEMFKEMMKYFAIIRLLNGIRPVGIKGTVNGVAKFLAYLTKNNLHLRIEQLTPSIASQYKSYLDGLSLSGASKSSFWQSVHVFLKVINGFENRRLKNPFVINPYMEYKRYAYKYIPEDVLKRLDVVFYTDEIELKFRLIYWLLRLIPSRISEILGMKIDCLKQFNGHYQLFIPTWKQNGGHREPILRTIRLGNEGISALLIELIEKQKKETLRIQEHLKEQEKGCLFAYQDSIVLDGTRYDKQTYRLMKWNVVSKMLKDVCVKYEIRDTSGDIYHLTSHQFRHNGVTDRLAAGFTMEQIAEMTGHHGKAIMFAGRILNLDEQLEKRLLKNIRAHRVRGGVCSDVTGCNNDMFTCLECECFIPEKEQLPYFMEQLIEWEKKVEIFKGIESINRMAQKNRGLFHNVINRLERGGK